MSKARVWSSLVLVALAGVLAGCGGKPGGEKGSAGAGPGGGGSTPAAGPGEAPAEVPGKPYANALLEIRVPDGWDFKDLNEGYPDRSPYAMLNLQKRGQACYVLVAVQRNTEETPEQHLEKFLRDNPNLRATPVESLTFGGARWAKTTYTYGTFQAVYVARFKDLHQVRITCQGEGADKDPQVLSILDSFRFKL
ncbi:MAG: hypothetical protein KA419_02245 [Acidobacteria bacterium]|nr:hypothetical protein [Acidobacteriota bacterium]